MSNLTRQNLVEAGVNGSYVAATGGGDTVDNDGRTFIHVKNGGGSPINVTITAQTATLDHPRFGTLARGNLVVSVPNAGDRFIGPFPTGGFNDAAGRVSIGYSAVTSVTIAALRLPPVN